MTMKEKVFKRVFLVVIDSFGVGAEPDWAEYGDDPSMSWVKSSSKRMSRFVIIPTNLPSTVMGMPENVVMLHKRESIS